MGIMPADLCHPSISTVDTCDKPFIHAGSCSCFTQFSIDSNPFTPSEETEEEVEEIIDHGGVRL